MCNESMNLEAVMRERKMNVLAREIMTGIHLGEIRTETGTTEEEGGVGVTAGVEVEVGAKRDCGTGIGTGAGAGLEAEHEAEVAVVDLF